MEMDRRSKAKSKIKLSTPSSHIFHSFEFFNDDGSNNTMLLNQQQTTNCTTSHPKDNQDDNEKVVHCPFQSLGIHKRLSNTITFERDPFALQKPTIIQARAISLLLVTLTNSSTSAQEQEDHRQNFFIHGKSETKTACCCIYGNVRYCGLSL